MIYLIARISEAIKLVKHISCHCKFRSSSTACNSNLKWNNDKKSKKYHSCKKDYSQNPSAGICENICVKFWWWKSLKIAHTTFLMTWSV